MCYFFSSLNEKERRQFAALEAMKLGRGGVAYLSRLLRINEKTIVAGMDELKKNMNLMVESEEQEQVENQKK